MENFARFAFTIGAAGLIAGCGGSQPPIGGASDIPTAAAYRSVPHSSWTRSGKSGQDLLYVSNGNGIVNIYNYSTQELIGELIDFTKPEGECTDRKGDVYITDYSTGDIDEYAHGATTAMRVINESPYNPDACAIDPKSGDLAVANYSDGGSYTQGSLAIYAHAKGKPKYYTSKALYQVNGVAYDTHGDLLVTGFYLYSGYYVETAFAYLAAKSKNLQAITLPPPNSSYGWGSVAGLGWDGDYFVVASYQNLYQYSINIKAELVGTVELNGAEIAPAFYERNRKKQATQAASTAYEFGQNDAAYLYQYPAGGKPYATITHGIDDPLGVAISLAK
jgi:hypothetical protein